MLRAAHTKSIHSKTCRTTTHNGRTRAVKEENAVIDGYTALAGTKRNASSARSNNSRGGVSKYSRNSQGGRMNVTSAQSAKETAEVIITISYTMPF